MRLPAVPKMAGISALSAARRLRDDPVGLVETLGSECGDLGRFNVGPRQVILVNSPDLVRQVLVGDPDTFGKGRIQRRALRPLMGDSLFTSEGELHRRQRRFAAPAFTPRGTVRHIEAIAALAEQWVDGLDVGSEIEILDQLSDFKLDLAGRLIMSTKLGNRLEFAKAVNGAQDYELRAMRNLLSIPLSVPTPANLRSRRAIKFLRRTIDNAVRERCASNSGGDDVLALLLAARDTGGNPIEKQLLVDEILALTLTASDTPTIALTWTLYYMMTHPETYARLTAEATEVLRGGAVTKENIGSLRYALQVYKESLRLTPVAPILMRTALQETALGGYRIPKGTVVLISPYALHRRTEIYPQPDRFDPERFSPENERKLPKYAFLPFGAGPHMCIGNHFTMLDGQIVLATLAQRVRLELVPGQRIEPTFLINIRPKYGIRAVVRRIDEHVRGDLPKVAK